MIGPTSVPTQMPLDELIALGRLVEGKTWLAEFLDVLNNILDEPTFNEDKDQLRFLQTSVADRIKAISESIDVPGDILIHVDSSFETRAHDLVTAQAAWCWGLALGKRACRTSGENDLRRLVELSSHDSVMQKAFLEQTAQALRDRQPQVTAAIGESIVRLAEHPEDFLLGNRHVGFSESLDVWKKRPAYEAFDLRIFEHLPIYFEFLAVFHHLKAIDRLDYLFWLDRLQNPIVLQHALLAPVATGDFDELLALLADAPPAYGGPNDKGWISQVAPILLEVALHQVQMLLAPFAREPRDEIAYTDLCSTLSERMDRLVRTLAERVDGPRLAADWLMRLVRIKTQLNTWLALPASINRCSTLLDVSHIGHSEKLPIVHR
jgi:hypothetical protein